MRFKRWITALSLSMLLWTGKAAGQTDSTAVAKPDADPVKKPWIQRIQDDNPFNGKDVRTTISLTDLRVRFTAGNAQISPVVGYNALTNRYIGGVTLAQDVDKGFRFEAGFFFRGNFDAIDTRENFRQYYMKGIFNLKSPPNKAESYRRIVVETGGFDRNKFMVDETGAYVQSTYEKTLPKLRLFGKKDTNKTLSISSYFQTTVVNGNSFYSMGARAEVMKPLEFTILKSMRFRVRVGPTAAWDSREGFVPGYRIVQSLNVFNPRR